MGTRAGGPKLRTSSGLRAVTVTRASRTRLSGKTRLASILDDGARVRSDSRPPRPLGQRPADRRRAAPAVGADDQANPGPDIEDLPAPIPEDDGHAAARRVGHGSGRARRIGPAGLPGPALASPACPRRRQAREALPLDHEPGIFAACRALVVRAPVRRRAELAQGERGDALARLEIDRLPLRAGDRRAPAPLGTRCVAAVCPCLVRAEARPIDGQRVARTHRWPGRRRDGMDARRDDDERRAASHKCSPPSG